MKVFYIKDLGFDGVELHGAHGYLIDQFFWEDTNQRKDGFGGSIQLRSSFASEIIKRAKVKVGNDFCIAIRTAILKNRDLYLQAGGGVVFDSDAEKEFQETINKSKALIKYVPD